MTPNIYDIRPKTKSQNQGGHCCAPMFFGTELESLSVSLYEKEKNSGKCLTGIIHGVSKRGEEETKIHLLSPLKTGDDNTFKKGVQEGFHPFFLNPLSNKRTNGQSS